MPVELFAPIVCRCPGLPFARFEKANADRATLWGLLDDPEFVDCVATMHHAALPSMRSRRARFRPDSRRSDIRRAELTLYRYLARFCSRNDTTGAAGSTIWGSLNNATTLIPQHGEVRSSTKSRVVYASPRHAELLMHRAAHGPLRDKAWLMLRPFYRWTGGGLLDPHHSAFTDLSPQEKALIERLAASSPQGVIFGTLDDAERPLAEHLVSDGVLTLRLGHPHEVPMTVLRAQSQGTDLAADVERLSELENRLKGAYGQTFATLMEEADTIASRLAHCTALSFPHVLRALVHRALDDAAMEVLLCPQWQPEEDAVVDVLTRVRRPLSDHEREVVARSREPLSTASLLSHKTAPHAGTALRKALVTLLDDGILTLAGAEDYRAGWPWDVRFKALSRALACAALAEPLATAARLLCQAYPLEPLLLNPVEAEARLVPLVAEDASTGHDVSLPGLDRTFFVCDSARVVDTFTLGGVLKARLERELAGWFRLAAWKEYERERAFLPYLRQLVPPRASVSLMRFLEDLIEHTQRDEVWREVRDDAGAATLFKVTGDPRTMCVSLVEAEPSPDFERWLSDKRLVSCLDLMLGGTQEELDAGGGLLLLAEAHAGSGGLGETIFFPQAHPGHSLQGHARQVFGEDVLFLQPRIPSKQSEGILMQLQDAALGIKNSESWWPQRRTIPIGRLMVSRRAEGLCVHDGESLYRLITDPVCVGNIRTLGYSPAHLAHWARGLIPGFASNGPLEIYPEVRLGDLVLTRWSLRLPAAFALKLLQDAPDGKALRLALCLPRFTFAKTHAKPILYDMDSPIGVEVLAAELAKARTVRFSPMQPAPEQLWLRLDDGHYTSELRMAVHCDGPSYTEGAASRFLKL